MREKCIFQAAEVTCLGYQIDRNGLDPVEDKVKTIKEASTPRNSTGLKSFLGLDTYYGNIILNLPSILAPLPSYENTEMVLGSSTGRGFRQSQTLTIVI